MLRKLSLVGMLFAILLSFSACSNSKREPEVSPAHIERLDMAMINGVPADSVTMRDDLALLLTLFGVDSVHIGEFSDSISSWRPVAAFADAVTERMTDLTLPARQIARAKERWPELTTDIPFPKIVAAISPYNQSVMIVDSTLYIATNHFLGSDFEGYEGFPEALRSTRTLGRMAPEAVEALVRSHFPAPEAGSTMLQAMAYEGAVSYVVGYLCGLDDSQLSDILAIAPGNLSSFSKQEHEIWTSMAANDLIFSTDPAAVGRMLSVRATPVAGAGTDLPGAGRFIGYRLIETLMKNAGEPIPLAELLSAGTWGDENLLRRAGYRP